MWHNLWLQPFLLLCNLFVKKSESVSKDITDLFSGFSAEMCHYQQQEQEHYIAIREPLKRELKTLVDELSLTLWQEKQFTNSLNNKKLEFGL